MTSGSEAFETFNREARGVVLLGIGLGYDLNDLATSGTDVTSNYVKEPPSQSPQQSMIVRLLSNPWVVSVGCGIIVAGMVAWLKWN